MKIKEDKMNAAEKAKYLQAKMNREEVYDTLETTKGMSKEYFCEMRERRLYDLPSNSDDPYYPQNEMKPIKEELYVKLSAKNTVCPQHPLNMDFLHSNEYSAEAIQVATHLGLGNIMVV
jgi:hypothetical protein